MNKAKREKGQEFINGKGNTVPEKVFKEAVCNCKKKCSTKLDLSKQKIVFENFYKLSTWPLKTKYIFGLIDEEQCKKRRKAVLRKNIEFKKKTTRKYYLKGDDAEKISVCKAFFQKVVFVEI